MVYFDTPPRAEALDEALRFAQTAVALDAQDAFCHMALGRVHIAQREYEPGLTACQAALGLNPTMGIAHCGLGDAFAYAGRVADAIPCFEKAIHLSPNDPWRWAFYSYGALALILMERYEQGGRLGLPGHPGAAVSVLGARPPDRSVELPRPNQRSPEESRGVEEAQSELLRPVREGALFSLESVE
jgi:tetratricopeptide (TPR) repeat protein